MIVSVKPKEYRKKLKKLVLLAMHMDIMKIWQNGKNYWCMLGFMEKQVLF
jgi:hypothetical protein